VNAKAQRAQKVLPCLLTQVIAACLLVLSCSQDMQEQPSYQAQEAPRKHSPLGSVPRESRAIPTLRDNKAARTQAGGRLFAINCSHCHGPNGEGDGPVAGYLKELPKNLRASHVQTKSNAELYDILTNGRDAMPAFKGELSAEERWAIVEFVKAMAP
jgi:mono/diheme cytochrome c family protein